MDLEPHSHSTALQSRIVMSLSSIGLCHGSSHAVYPEWSNDAQHQPSLQPTSCSGPQTEAHETTANCRGKAGLRYIKADMSSSPSVVMNVVMMSALCSRAEGARLLCSTCNAALQTQRGQHPYAIGSKGFWLEQCSMVCQA